MSISFHYVSVPALNLEEETLNKWINNIAENEGYHIDDLSYIFCNDEYLLNINIQHLQHNTLTDIITFDLSDTLDSDELEAEIYISIERVMENSLEFSVSFEEELARVLVHGVLHLCGYDDYTPEEINLIREKESFYIKEHPLTDLNYQV